MSTYDENKKEPTEKAGLDLLKDQFSTPPDFVNEKGIKWWIDKDTTEYARNPDNNGICLNVRCFLVQETSGRKTRVIVSDNSIIYENQNYEAFCTKIDNMKTILYGTEELKNKR